MSVEQRLQELKITLPEIGSPLGNYVHAKRVGNLLYLSGKGPENADGTMPRGKLGAGMSVEEGYRHARRVGLVLIAAIKAALGAISIASRGSSRCSAWSTPHPISRTVRKSSTVARTSSSRSLARLAGMRARRSA